MKMMLNHLISVTHLSFRSAHNTKGIRGTLERYSGLGLSVGNGTLGIEDASLPIPTKSHRVKVVRKGKLTTT
jgi:hypothetical protein